MSTREEHFDLAEKMLGFQQVHFAAERTVRKN
jgi:hypothetical protein